MNEYIDFEIALNLFPETLEQISNQAKEKKYKADHLYIITDFQIVKDFSVLNCIVEKSKEVEIDEYNYSFISKIHIFVAKEESSSYYKSACFALVLSSIMSFSTGRIIKFYRNIFNFSSEKLIASNIPLRKYGPSAHTPPKSEELTLFIKKITDIATRCSKLEKNKLNNFLRSCRLFQLSKLNRLNDHNLSSSLIISCIESTSDKAISIQDVKENWKEEKKNIQNVAKAAQLSNDFTEMLRTKLEQHYSSLRFLKFIRDYTNFEVINLPDLYVQEVDHSPKQQTDYEKGLQGIDKINNDFHYFKAQFNCIKIDDELEINKNFNRLIKDTYTYRSKFYHAGESIANNNTDLKSRYFKTISIKDKMSVYKEKTIITYQFLCEIATNSIKNYYLHSKNN